MRSILTVAIVAISAPAAASPQREPWLLESGVVFGRMLHDPDRYLDVDPSQGLGVSVGRHLGHGVYLTGSYQYVWVDTDAEIDGYPLILRDSYLQFGLRYVANLLPRAAVYGELQGGGHDKSRDNFHYAGSTGNSAVHSTRWGFGVRGGAVVRVWESIGVGFGAMYLRSARENRRIPYADEWVCVEAFVRFGF